jgi:GNAT superfamily N-acetyltransferase
MNFEIIIKSMSRKAPPISIRELAPQEMPVIFPLIAQLNPELTRREFDRCLKEMLANNYRCVGAYEGKKLIGVMGLWLSSRFWCGRFLEADNVVVDKNARSAGVGQLMMAWLDKEAKRLKCSIVKADAYTSNFDSHRFYLRERYVILGFSFVKKLRKS